MTLSSALLAGLAGSAHCATMCGGVAGALGMRARQHASGGAAWHLLAYQGGRIASYGLAGAGAGAIARHAFSVAAWWHLANALRLLAGLALVGFALSLLLSRGGSRFRLAVWSHLLRVARRAPSGLTGSVLLGAIWGFMPCGMVYAALALAAVTGSALPGMGAMLAFGIGTLPAVSLGLFAGLKAGTALGVSRGLRACALTLLLLFGTLTAYSALASLRLH
jgi:sulfite exporter TauE/SafE